MVAIVGKSGAGKTTIANLICNLYNANSGTIMIDGIDIKEYNLHSLRSQVGIVHQETILYDNTLRYNLSFSHNKEADCVLIDAMRRVGLYDVFLTFPDGLDTVLGSEGYGLSGGQRQRLGIARILIKKPRILIFDEATSFLDSYNEKLIRNMISDMAGKCTIIVIAHRLSTIKNCDKIAVLADGAIHGFDTHEKLIKHNEVYIDLFKEQCIVEGGEL